MENDSKNNWLCQNLENILRTCWDIFLLFSVSMEKNSLDYEEFFFKKQNIKNDGGI